MIIKFVITIIILLLPISIQASEPSILINELAWMGTATSASDEWIELYNGTDSEIDLTGWKLEATDGSPSINLEGTISAGGYFLLERTDDDSAPEVTADQIYTGALSNTSEHLKLYDAENNLIDEIDAGDGWPGGDNSTKQTLERIAGGAWQTSLEPGGTPRAENSTVAEEEEEEEESEEEANDANEPESEEEEGADNSSSSSKAKALKGDIIINEVFPNPKGIDTEKEFIEIKNISTKNIDLTNWRLTNLARQTFVIPSLMMTPQSIVVFERTQTNLALNNYKEKVTLYSTSGGIIDQMEYKGGSVEGESYQRGNGGKLVWQTPSVGKDNIFEEIILPTAVINGPKEAEFGEIISLDGSDSFDVGNREFKLFWDFGDGWADQGLVVRHIYADPGNYEVKLTAWVSDKASSTEKLKIKVSGEIPEPEKPQTPTSTASTSAEIFAFNNIPFIFISEFLPNPEGSDAEGEFIEIFNQEAYPINLAGWQLDDAEGGSRPYAFPAGTIIKPGEYKTFYRTETELALNNSDEAVRLIAPDGTIIDYADYEESKEGQSFVLDENFIWQETKTPTPGEINVLETSDKRQATSTKDVGEPKVLGATDERMIEDIEDNEPKNKMKYIVSGISAALVLGLGALVKMRGKT